MGFYNSFAQYMTFASGIMRKQQVLRISRCDVFLENLKYTSTLTGKLEIFFRLSRNTPGILENLQQNFRYS